MRVTIHRIAGGEMLEHVKKLAAVSARDGHLLSVNLGASRAAKLLKLRVEGLAVGADASMPETSVLRVSSVISYGNRKALIGLAQENCPSWVETGCTRMLRSAMSSSTPSILLDLDGTLIDSQPGILSSCRAALRALGHVPEPELDLSAIIGPPIDDIMRLLLEPYADDRVAESVTAYRADYGQNGLFDSLPYSGIAQALAEMRQSGARLYLATSKRTIFALPILEYLDLAAFFDGIYGSEAGGALDHKPELISHIIKGCADAEPLCHGR
jgi:phosphoglycolate phosphatase